MKYNYEELQTVESYFLKDRIPIYREAAVFALVDDRGKVWVSDGMNMTRSLVRADKALGFASVGQRLVADTYTEIAPGLLDAAAEGRRFEAIVCGCFPCDMPPGLLHQIRDSFVSFYRDQGREMYN